MVKISLSEFTNKAKLVKINDSYEVYDLTFGSIVVSMTTLHPDKATTGHFHGDTEEVYYFISGRGEIHLDNTKDEITQSDIVLVPKGVFHKVCNKGNEDLIFLCYFNKYQDRG
jgi:mannose-6-phosphate isomerase-like protein (cupin superfamily)